MPSLESVLKFREEMYQESVELIRKKGHDYNRQQQLAGDTLFNLKVAEILGIVPTAERGILVRLSDKFMRLISLMTPGVEHSVKGESVRDTVRDIHNYIDYALQIWEERQQQEKMGPQPGEMIAVDNETFKKLGKFEYEAKEVELRSYRPNLVPERKMSR